MCYWILKCVLLFLAGKLEAEIKSQNATRQENSELRGVIQQQQDKLAQCQTEIGESHAQLLRLEQLAQRLQERALDRSAVSL